jgi:RNA polymerase sigma-70 factor (ECF subfamily)
LIFRPADDRDLIERARKGDVESFNLLVARWDRRIYNYLLRLAPDAEEAFDLAQETFLKAYQSLDRLDDAARFGAWLYRVAHNLAVSQLRRQRPATTETGELPELPVNLPGAFGLLAVETSLAVRRALEALSGEQREAVVLKVCDGFKFEEIAEIVNAPVSTVKSRVYTALDVMRGVLA